MSTLIIITLLIILWILTLFFIIYSYRKNKRIRKNSIFLGILSIAYPILIVVLIAMYVGLL